MNSKIFYKGIKYSENQKVGFIVFSNDSGQEIEVPLSPADAKRISMYLDKISTVPRSVVKRLNDEPSE